MSLEPWGGLVTHRALDPVCVQNGVSDQLLDVGRIFSDPLWREVDELSLKGDGFCRAAEATFPIDGLCGKA